jgi:nucleoside-diphosphate-sugar epimerase
MNKPSIIILGGTGLIGAAVCERFRRDGHAVVAVDSKNYGRHTGAEADMLINCNGNSYRYKASQDPAWDFQASVATVEKSLFDFKFGRYFFISTVDVYDEPADSARNHEEAAIDPRRLPVYGFHKWLAERLVERSAAEPLILRTGTVVGPEMKKGPLFDLVQNEPLHMSVDSELSLVDTATVAEVIAAAVAVPPVHRIINLTGTGPARLCDLCAAIGLSWRLAPGAEQVVHRYHINNARLRELFPVRTSHAIGAECLAQALKKRP